MIIYLADRNRFDIDDDYETMMTYTTVLFGMSEQDYWEIKNNRSITDKKLVFTDEFFDNQIKQGSFYKKRKNGKGARKKADTNNQTN